MPKVEQLDWDKINHRKTFKQSEVDVWVRKRKKQKSITQKYRKVATQKPKAKKLPSKPAFTKQQRIEYGQTMNRLDYLLSKDD